MKKLVYICAPYRGDVKKNIENAKNWAKQIYELGDVPVTPHLMFPFLANDDFSVLDSCIALLARCDALVICGEKITEGMQIEIDYARIHNLRMKCGRIEDWIEFRKGN